MIVGVRHGHTQRENAKDIEEGNTPKGLSDGPRDVLSGVWSLTKGDSHDFGTHVSVAGLDNGGPEAKQVSRLAWDEVLCKSTRVFPISESNDITAWSSTKGNHEAGHDEGGHDDNLGKTKPEFCFTEGSHIQ